MRKPRDGEDTRARVLQAAEELFAEKGFSGASLALISQRCGISDGLILHHFQSKQNLYRQVLEALAGRYTRELFQASGGAASPQEMMQQALAASFNCWKQDSAYQRISLWAYLEGETGLADQEAALTVELVRQVGRLQEQGLVSARYTPMVFLTMIIGPIHFWLRYRDHFKDILNLPEPAAELDRLFLDQLVTLVGDMARR